MQPNEPCNATVHFADEGKQKESYQTFPLHLSKNALDWDVLECNAVWCLFIVFTTVHNEPCREHLPRDINKGQHMLHETQASLSINHTLTVH